jgi:hypothetical protein
MLAYFYTWSYLIFVRFWSVKAYPVDYRGLPVIGKILPAAVQCASPSKSCSGSWDWVHKVQRTATRCVPAVWVGIYVILCLAMCEKAVRLSPLLMQIQRGLLGSVPSNLDRWYGLYTVSQKRVFYSKTILQYKLLNFLCCLPVCMYQLNIRCWEV